MAGGTEYLIPYTSRPDFTDLENGKIYTAREALKIYAKDYPVQIVHLMPWEKDPKLNGGAYRIVYNYTPFYIGGAVLLLIAAGIVILIIRKKKNIKITAVYTAVIFIRDSRLQQSPRVQSF